MSDDLVKRLLEPVIDTFFGPVIEPIKKEAASRIENLEAALREITSVSKVYVANGEDMARALTTLLASHRKIALAALEGKE